MGNLDKKYLLIYHKEDNDGVFSAAIMYNYLVNTLHINVDNIHRCPADYNILDEFSKKCDMDYLKDNYDSIIMADISFSDWKYMKNLYKTFDTDFIWCDHHAPIIHLSQVNKFSGVPGIRETNRSAILCVWKYLYDQFDEEYNKAIKGKSSKIPFLFRILSAWDSFTFKNWPDFTQEYCKNVNIGVNNKYQLDFEKIYNHVHCLVETYLNSNPCGIFSVLHKDKPLIKELENNGKIINSYQDFVMTNIIENNGDCTWKIITDNSEHDDAYGHWGPTYRTACAIFHQGATNSLMFKCLNKGDKDDIMNGIVFKHLENGNWTISLYNIREQEPDVSAGGFHCGDYLRKHYNGGGHAGAAGCTVTEKEFIKILKNKQLG